MMLRMQLERQGALALPLDPRVLHAATASTPSGSRGRSPDAIVMHPGPMNRGVEIASDVADSARSVILDQVANGVAVRMAVLYLLLDRPSAGRGKRREQVSSSRGGRVVDPAAGRDGRLRRAPRGRRRRGGRRRGSPPADAEVFDASRASRLPGLHRPARPPARARARVRRDDRDRPAAAAAGRLHGRLRHAEHRPGQRQPRRLGVRRVAGRAPPRGARLYPIGAITQGQKGEELAEFGEMRRGGRRRVLRRRQLARRRRPPAPRLRARAALRHAGRPARRGPEPLATARRCTRAPSRRASACAGQPASRRRRPSRGTCSSPS